MAKSFEKVTKYKFQKFLQDKAVRDKGCERVGLMKELDKHQTRNELLEDVNERLYYVITNIAEEYQQIELEACRNINNVINNSNENS
ncbi:hypothetical protein R5R35_001343 [Gryllus longicercus]|uniref:Uncharacterized protein n=1 Tax=Gryllus longicercus TaxID=2509291 RepID=A0AAN9VES3_9ORTH